MSLVELLTVIGVIGVMGAMGMGIFSNYMSGAEDVKAKRNAQSIAAVAAAAQACGDSSIALAADKSAAISIVVTGSMGAKGVFAEVPLTITPISPEDIAAAEDYLAFEDGTLVYQTVKGAPPSGGSLLP